MFTSPASTNRVTIPLTFSPTAPPVSETPKPRQRPTITVSDQQLRDLTVMTQYALEKANDPPSLFVRSGELVRIREDEVGRPITEAVTEGILRSRMSQVADFVRPTKNGVTSVVPPMYIPKDILALGTW